MIVYETILCEKNNGVMTIALNRPEKLNAFDGRMHEELHDALDNAATDDEVRCVVQGVAAFFEKREPNFTGR
jgi:enoyl-CoA hydratase/carnithine racemase